MQLLYTGTAILGPQSCHDNDNRILLNISWAWGWAQTQIVHLASLLYFIAQLVIFIKICLYKKIAITAKCNI